MPKRNRIPETRSARLYDGHSLRADIYRHAVIVARMEWKPRQSDHPGDDGGGSAATVEYAVLPLGDELWILSKQDFDDNPDHESLPEHEKPSRIQFVGGVDRDWGRLKERVGREAYHDWQLTWLVDDVPPGDAEHLLADLEEKAEPKLARLKQAAASLDDGLESLRHALGGSEGKELP